MTRSLLLAALIALSVLMQPFALPAAAAHPLGNFTVNRYALVVIGAQEIRVHYVLDMAEVPTYQERLVIDKDRDGRISDAESESYATAKTEEIRRHLRLTLNGEGALLAVEGRRLSFLEGQAGLPTLRLESRFLAPVGFPLLDAVLKDENEPRRIGWREIVVQANNGISLTASSVSQKDVSDGLRRYPDDLLSTPLDLQEARFSAALASGSQGTDVAPGKPAASNSQIVKAQDAFAALILADDLDPGSVLLALLAAMALGAVHALAPGHGKTIVAAYLVGSRGTVRHALALGLTVTGVHTVMVYALGLVTLAATAYVLPEQVYPWLSLLSGLIVALIGGRLLWVRLHTAWRSLQRHDDGSHPQEHHHDDHHPHEHTHLHEAASNQRVTWRSLLALGISGGLLPCPSALIVMLSAIAVHKVAFGLALIVAFSVGLAGVLSGIGLMLVFMGGFFMRLQERFGTPRPAVVLAQALPSIGAVVVMAVGLVLVTQSIGQL